MIAVNWFPINTVGFLILAKVILQIGCILGDGGVPQQTEPGHGDCSCGDLRGPG